MVLGRRKRKSQWQRLHDAVWPRSGVRRGAKYIAYRIVRLPGTAYSIAAGVAAGAAVSFTPFLGFHFVLGCLLALVTGGNVLASVIGTAVGNPWSFPFIWPLIYTIGRWFLGMGEGEGLSPALTMSDIFHQPMEVLYPMTIGAIPTAITAWIVFFIPVYAGVRRYQTLRLARRHRAGRRAKRLRNNLRPIEGDHG